jgi:hypothetical protein
LKVVEQGRVNERATCHAWLSQQLQRLVSIGHGIHNQMAIKCSQLAAMRRSQS